jgi:hypothetical protein
MRKLGLRHSLTARLWQAGLEWDEAKQMGASKDAWAALEERYNGGSIPQSEWLGSPSCAHCEFVKHLNTGYGY